MQHCHSRDGAAPAPGMELRRNSQNSKQSNNLAPALKIRKSWHRDETHALGERGFGRERGGGVVGKKEKKKRGREDLARDHHGPPQPQQTVAAPSGAEMSIFFPSPERPVLSRS